MAQTAEVPLGTFNIARLGRLREALDERVAEGGVAGVTSAVFHHGEKVFEHSAGDLRPDSIVRMASMTKVITSVCVLALVEEGVLHLFEDLTERWLPELAGAQVIFRRPDGTLGLKPRQNRITLHQLLTHTAGLSYPFVTRESGPEQHPFAEAVGMVQEAYKANKVWSVPFDDGHTSDEFMQRLGKCPLLFEPGSQWHYGLNTDVAGIVVERATRKPLSEVMLERVFAPLGMRDTAFHVPEDKLSRFAEVYEPQESGKGPVQPRGDGIEPHPGTKDWFQYHKLRPFVKDDLMCSGGGGLTSTLEDYVRFLNGLIASIKGVPFAGASPLVSRRNAALLASDAMPPTLPRSPFGAILQAGQSHTLGCQVLLQPAVAGQLAPAGTLSWGGIFGTQWIANVEEEVVAVLLTQRYPNEEVDVRSKFTTLVFQALA